ncbi:MAG: DUF4198 domain-containing protein [Desulfobacterales bacterium]|nr:DUF4198 domain-containing protein [Desulfobacterales bacterium]
MKKIIFSVMVIIFLLSQAAFAHHLWVEKEGGRFKIAWGHPPKVDSYEPDRVKEIRAFNKKGKEITLKRTDEKDKVYLSSKEDVSMITLSFEGGYLVSTPDGKKRLTKRDAQKAGLQVIDSFYSSQFAKSLFAFSDAVIKPVEMKFEIVPLKNPYTLKPDGLLPIKVLFEGKPLGGATINVNAHKEAAKTDRDGIVNIPIAGQGMQVISATYRVTTKDNPDADYLSFTTVLTMELK